jgi:hypothetical protein
MCDATDCGKTYGHDWHLFATERGKVKACDGDLGKWHPTTTEPEGGER